MPGLGNGGGISLGAERQLGDRIARELYRDPDYLEDPVLDEYIQRLWTPLLKAATARGELSPELQERFAWRILLGRDRSVNAFALPGGYLGVHLGLIAVVGSNDELASVLAHELSHVTQRHIARSMDTEAKMSPLMIGAMLLGVLAASKSPQSAQALIVGGQAAAIQSQLSYSRDMEREADRVGYGVLTDAGYDPQGFAGMFAKLQQAAGVNDNGAYPYLRSHPLTTERMADMQSRQPLGGPQSGPSNDLARAMLSARARVISQNSAEALAAWAQRGQVALPQGTLVQKASTLYAAVLAQQQLRNPQAAEQNLQALSQLVNSASPSDTPQAQYAQRLVRLLRAEVAFGQERFDDALKWLPNLSQQPTERPELMATAEALLRLPAHPGQARITQKLRDQVTQAPHDAQAWNTLARLLAMQGQALASLRAEGEAQLARMDWSGAADRFRAAQAWAKSHTLQPADLIEASIVDSRLRQAQARIREMQTER